MIVARNTIGALFGGVDVLVTPTSMRPPPTIDASLASPPDESGMIRNTLPFDVYGLPTISVPCGFTRTGLPIGLQISGPPWAKRECSHSRTITRTRPAGTNACRRASERADSRRVEMMRTRQWTVAAAAVLGLAVQGAFAASPTTGPGAVTGGNFTPPPPDRVPVCTRASLKTAVDAYLAAQGAGDARKIAFAEKARYRENMKDVDAAAGTWNKPLKIAFSRSIYDEKRCKTFSEVIVNEGTPYVIGTRLYVDDGKVTRIDSIVTTKGDWLFNANNYLKFSKAEDWAITAAQRTKPEDMINGANAYLDLFADKLREAPWGQPCARLEGGAYTNGKPGYDLNDPKTSCKVGIPNGVLYIVNRDYVVDEEQGVVNVFCRFGNSDTGMPDSHTFHYVSGKYRWVHTLSQSLPRESPQVADY